MDRPFVRLALRTPMQDSLHAFGLTHMQHAEHQGERGWLLFGATEQHALTPGIYGGRWFNYERLAKAGLLVLDNDIPVPVHVDKPTLKNDIPPVRGINEWLEAQEPGEEVERLPWHICKWCRRKMRTRGTKCPKHQDGITWDAKEVS